MKSMKELRNLERESCKLMFLKSVPKQLKKNWISWKMPYKDKQRGKEYREKHREKHIQYGKKYYQENKYKKKKYQQDNKERISKRQKEYNQRPEIKQKERERGRRRRQKPEYKIYMEKYHQEYDKEYRQRLSIKIRIRENTKKYRQRPEYEAKRKEYHQRPEVKERKNQKTKQRRKIDINFRIQKRLRTLLHQALKLYTKTGKIKSSKKYGVNYKEIIEYLKPFPEDISLYHVDHRKPLCCFNLEDSEEVKKAFAPENHQWLTIQENLIKGGRE